jgi:hypothetical protein
VDSPHDPQILGHVLCPERPRITHTGARFVDTVDSLTADCPHCPQNSHVMWLWTVHIVHKANRGQLLAVGSPHDPRGWVHEGEGGGPSGWANGNVASADNFYFLI